MDQWIESSLDQSALPGLPDRYEDATWESDRGDRASMVDQAMFARPPIARTGGQHARRREHLLSLLLGQIAEEVRVGSKLLRPVWAREAASRAANLYCLVQLMRPLARMRDGSPMIHRTEYALAHDLALLCRLTAAPPDREMVPCSTVLRDAIGTLVALFEGTADVRLCTDIERIRLPAYKRRALVLVAIEFVALALIRGCQSRAGGRLMVSVGLVNDCNARLIVADDIAASRLSQNTASQFAARELSDLLEGELTYPECSWADTVAKVEFPARP